MRLYLVQHGEAVEKEEDPERPLSSKGKKDVEAVGRFLSKAGVRASRVWHSGKARARQTAEILACHLAPKAILEQRAGLDPKDEPGIAAKDVERCGDDLIVAGHLPHLERLAGQLLAGKEKAAPVAFERGGVVALERAGDAAWRIVWMIVPSLLGRL
jgi:phosphohistidine phosphatase